MDINTFLKHKKLMLESLGIAEGVDDPSIFKAVFMAGGPGSGKSYVVNKLTLEPLGFKIVNSDEVYERMLKKAGLKTTPEDIFSPTGQQIRVAAKQKSDIRQNAYLDGKLGVIIDGTGKDYNKISQMKTYLDSLGYETAMVFVNSDIDTAQKRNAKRERSLPADQVDAMWKSVQNNIGKFSNLFRDNFYIIDNSEANIGDSIEKATNKTFVKLKSWADKPVTNPIAKQWISSKGGRI
jgi:cytidylate kinase